MLQKLVDVTELVQEEFRIDHCRRRNEYGVPKRDRRRRARTERPTGYANGHSAATIRRLSEIWITTNHILGELDSLSDQRPDES